MNTVTKQLANGIKQALLDLPDPILHDTVEGWLTGAETADADPENTDAYRMLCGYQPRCVDSGVCYRSLEALYDQEPDAEYTWVAPSIERMREIFSALRPEQIYHNLLPLVDDGLQRHAFHASFGFPPWMQGNGCIYMSQLTRYLGLIKTAGTMTADQFEWFCQEKLEAAFDEEEQAEETDLAGDPHEQSTASTREKDTVFYRSLLRADERSLDIEIALLTPDPGLRASLLQELEKLGCSYSVSQQGRIEGTVEYKVWRSNETRAVGGLRRLLDRWQEKGYLSWSGQRLLPLKSHHKPRKHARLYSAGGNSKNA